MFGLAVHSMWLAYGRENDLKWINFANYSPPAFEIVRYGRTNPELHSYSCKMARQILNFLIAPCTGHEYTTALKFMDMKTSRIRSLQCDGGGITGCTGNVA